MPRAKRIARILFSMKRVRTVLALTILAGAVVQPIDAQKKHVAKFEGASVHVYKRVGKVALRLYVFAQATSGEAEPRAAAVFFFGGGWKGGSVQQFESHARYLASRGMVGILADYRVSSRHKTTPFECVEDGKSAVRWIRAHAEELGIDPQRIAAGGGSAGGHVAAAAGNCVGFEPADAKPSSRPNALLLFNPVFDNGPKGYGHRRVKARWREISPLHNLRKGAPPTLVFLGSKDGLVPVATAKRYRDTMRKLGSRCELHVYEGQPHGFFNKSRSPKHWYLTIREIDRFLTSLRWLRGDPTIQRPAKKRDPGKRPARKGATSERRARKAPAQKKRSVDAFVSGYAARA